MSDIKHKILKHALPLVPFDGWSDYTLQEAAKRAGIATNDPKKVFPGGVKECVAFFLDEENKELSSLMEEQGISKLRVPERIEKIILIRLKLWQAKREVIRRTVSFNALPWHNLNGLRTLYNAVDLMWRLAGDSSTDFNYYTKRMTLAGVYSSTLLFWLNDTSEDQKETKAFLKRRLDNVAAFGRFKKQVSSCAS